MISRIVSLSPQETGGFAPLLAGAPPSIGAPLLLGYEMWGGACGALAADCFEDSVTLRWLCVDTPCRRRGIGGEMVRTLCDLAAGAGARRIDAIVCRDSSPSLEALLVHRGFVPVEESPVYSFPLSAVLTGSLAALAAKRNPRLVPLRSLPQYLLRDFNRRIARPDGPMYPPIEPEALLAESLAWVEKDEVTGCVLLAPCGEGVELRWLHAQGAAAVQGLLAGAVGAVAANYAPETLIHVTALIDSADALVHRLAGPQLVQHQPVVHYCLETDD